MNMTSYRAIPFKFFVVLLSGGLLAACASTPSTKLSAEARPAIEREVKRPEPPNQVLTPQVLYELLLAEIATQRNQQALATRAYLDLMQNTNDYRVAERAAQVALNGRFADEALVAAQRWLVLEPDSIDARQAVAGLLITKGKLEEAVPYLRKILAAEDTNVGYGFLHLNNLLARHPNKSAALSVVQELARDYPSLPEAHFAIARAAWDAGDKELTLKETNVALSLRPDWEGAALFKVQVLHDRSPAAALEYYTSYLRTYPQAREMRLAYARLLVQEKQYPQAREEFQKLITDFPDSPEVPLAVGLLSMQLHDYDAADVYLRKALDSGVKDDDAVRFYLGQLSEERKHWDEAKQWYGAVNGEQAFSAQLHIAGVLARQGKLAEARSYLQHLDTKTNQERAQAASAEALLLRDAKQYQEAFDVLGRALEKLPNHPDLLYDYAMAAEKIGRVDVLEASLKKLILVKPDHAQAYNALGYTLADRTARYDEAKKYLDQALKLLPEDAYILDSMGWLQYRTKDYPQSISTLRRAFSLRPDPEIAAHLGEVLWVSGEKTEAQKVWDGALKDNPGDEALTAAVLKFKAQ
jgi:tetratricopeptide (TPR) repeat protein